MADFITEIRARRVLPAVGVYVASSWVVIEILDRLVERYLLSPYLTDIVFWGLYSMIPAVMLIAWTHGKPGKDKTTRLEKVGVPINVIASLGLLITVFGGKDLDLAATQITVSNELGQQEIHYITSETFRRRMAIFFWKNESGNPDLDWLQYGVTELLVQDLQQDPFVLANSPWNNFGDGFYSRIRQAGYRDGLNVPRSLMRKIANEANRQYFVEGSFTRTVNEYQVTASIWDTQTLDQVAQLTESGGDIYTAIDRLSRAVRKALDVPESSSRIAEDLPLTETYGNSEGALKAYVQALNARLFDNDFERSNAYLDEALEIDPGFVLGWYIKATNKVASGDLPGAQEALSKAQELDYRLASHDRTNLKSIVYQLNGEHEKLMALLRLQTQVRDDAASHNSLANWHMRNGDLEPAKVESLLALDRDALNVGIYLRMSELERATGDMEAAIKYARSYQQHKPEDIEASVQLGDLFRDSGKLILAEEHYKQAQILQNAPVRPTLKLSMIAARKGNFKLARHYLLEAEGFARSPTEKIQVKEAIIALELRLGRITEAVRQTYAQQEYVNQSMGLLDGTLSIYTPLIDLYIQLGNLNTAISLLDAAKDILAPPVDKFLAFSEAAIHAEENDIEAAYVSLQELLQVIDQYQLKYLGAQVSMVRASISEAEGDFAAVASHYKNALREIEHSVVLDDARVELPRIYSEVANAQIETGVLDAAEQSINSGFSLDPSEPQLWIAKARLQQAQELPRMALASANYALAIWKDADEDYVNLKKARSLVMELQNHVQ